jgi:hypothetical protein
MTGRWRGSAAGFTAIEVLLAMAIMVTVIGIAVPVTSDALDQVRTAMAARYLEGKIMDARMQAVRRSARVALRFEAAGDDYRFAEYLDGNGNGVRATDIASGADPELAGHQLLRDHFRGVSFGLRANIPDINGTRTAAAGDGLRIGTSRLLTLGPDGTATSGTMYVRGRRGQYAIRILGATGRTRVLRFDPGSGQWVAR